MIADYSSPPARATVCRKMAGSGLETPNVSAPQIAENRGLKSKPVEQELRQPFQLVGADREAIAERFEIIERGLDALEWARSVGDMGSA